jgi:CRISPR/Cas system CMR-associated protein Cmr5 small subunit
VEKVVVWMDKYGSKSERFEPVIVRDAYLRAIKPTIKEKLGELVRSRYSEDEKKAFKGLVERAQKWKLSLDDLAVPIEVRTMLDLK